MPTHSPRANRPDPDALGSTPPPDMPDHHRFHADALADRPSATGSTHILGLDGLRAVAVLLVLCFHFGLGWLGGGFFGVDMFYVLSGYLITGLLLAEFERREHIGLVAFWLRRARRLLPALLVVLSVVTLLVRFAEPSGAVPGFRGSALSALFYVSNWWQIASSGNYFVATGATSPLTHTWSLAVEEQFYLVWPLVVLAVLHVARSFRRGVRALLVVATAGVVASVVEMVVLFHPGANPTRIYFGTDTHAQSVLVGAVLACVLTLIERRRGETGMDPEARAPAARAQITAVGLVGMALVVALSHALGGSSPATYRGGFFLVAICSALAIAAVVAVPGGILARTLSLAPLVWLGTISYGIYLWHFPVVIFLDSQRTGLGGPALFALRTTVTVVVAAVSFYLIERPVIERRFWQSVRAAGPALVAVAATVAVVMVGTTGQATAAPTTPAGLIGTGATAAEWRAVNLTHFAPSGNRIRVLMVGDSLSLTVAVGMARYASTYGLDLGGRSHTGCGVAVVLPLSDHGVVGDPFGNCPMWPAWWTDDVVRLRPQVVGVVTGFWEVVDRMYQGRWQHLGDPAFDAYESAQLERAVTILSSRGAKVALFTSPYFHTGEQANGNPWPQDDPARVDRLNQLIVQVATRHPGVVTVVPLNRFLDPAGHFTWTLGGHVARQGDGVHTTLSGGTYLAPRVLPLLAALGRQG